MRDEVRGHPGDGPDHVAIIMDGNGRWAARRGLPRLRGHRRGADIVREIVEACPDHGVRFLTLFAFSTENWKRPPREVTGLMALFRRYMRKDASELDANGVRVRFIGGRERLDPTIRRLMAGLEARTAGNSRLHLTIAIDYGGRDEIARAARRLAERVAAGEVRPEAVSEASLAGFLDTAGLPDPDLVIRTSGEQRVSNFLLWQAAYAEYAFVPECWPDFSALRFGEVLQDFALRERRLGAVPV